jgi:phage shock protein E
MKIYARIIVLCLGVLLHNALATAQIPDNAVWIDVRSPVEFERGHLPQATLIPHEDIAQGVTALNLPKDTPIYLYCAVGGRAEKAKLALEAMDYSAVTNVGGLGDARQLIAGNKP